MTDEQLQQLAALAEAATPGPWWVDRYATDMSCTEHAVGVRTDDMMLASMGIDDVAMPDARFIAAARAAVPALVAEVERLQTELAAARIAALAYRVLSEVCRECEGTGEVDSGAPKPEGGDYYTVTCPSCNGTGKPFFGADLSPERQARLQRYIDGGAR